MKANATIKNSVCFTWCVKATTRLQPALRSSCTHSCASVSPSVPLPTMLAHERSIATSQKTLTTTARTTTNMNTNIAHALEVRSGLAQHQRLRRAYAQQTHTQLALLHNAVRPQTGPQPPRASIVHIAREPGELRLRYSQLHLVRAEIELVIAGHNEIDACCDVNNDAKCRRGREVYPCIHELIICAPFRQINMGRS